MWLDTINKDGIWVGLSFMACDCCIDQAYIVEKFGENIYLNCTQLKQNIIDLTVEPYNFVKWKYIGIGHVDIFNGN